MSYRDYDLYRAWGDQDLDFDGCLDCGKRPDKFGNIVHKKNCIVIKKKKDKK